MKQSVETDVRQMFFETGFIKYNIVNVIISFRLTSRPMKILFAGSTSLLFLRRKRVQKTTQKRRGNTCS